MTLQTFLDGVRDRWRAELRLRTLGRAAGAVSLPLFGIFAASRLMTADDALAVLTIAALAMAAAGAWMLVRRVRERPADRQVARFVEERVADLVDAPPLEDALVSAVEARESSSPEFAALVRQAATERLKAITPSTIVPARRLRRAAWEACGGSALLVASVVLVGPALVRTAHTSWRNLFPPSIHVEVLPGDARVVTGQPLTVRASILIDGTPQARIAPELVVTDGTDERAVAMVADGNGFRFSFESVDRTFRYHVGTGSARSSTYTVTAILTPRVTRIDLRYEYPDFSGLAPREERDGGDILAPAGTRVHVRVHTDKTVSAGEVAFAGASALPLTRTDPQVLDGVLVLSADDSYRIQLTDDDGLRSRSETEYFIRLMDDRPPDVRILRPAGDQQITPLEEVAIEARADDDYGVAMLELVYSVSGAAAKVVPFERVSGTEVTRLGAHVLAAEDLRVRPGDVISYYARARDIGRGKRSTMTRSDMFFLEVRPFAEEFVAAQSSALGGATGEQIDSLIAAQKEIINATWNLERRSAAGRSVEDIKAVSRAQAELKVRVEEMVARGGGGRSPFPPPLQVAPPRQGRMVRQVADPVEAATRAMARAITELDGQKTEDALPHEMAALQGLLQAQAEIRRREVLQQQAGTSAGGMGRQGQDLSALFDKELQRQQRTNYESRSQVDERPDRQAAAASALERIRDLARRQEELSRRERELAGAGLSAEERKRQLERLSREQTELREQLDKLSNETRQGQSSGQSASSASGAMREAADEMRNAEGQLARQDPESAARNAARAADKLRQLERQVHGDSPEARQRAAGELRLEAQQIADEQRRIGAEASRLEKGAAGASADAWRRLAGEKDKLADRVDELQRSAERLTAGEAKDPARTGRDRSRPPDAADKDRAGAQAAARELEEQQVARRMRDTAKAIREDLSRRSPELAKADAEQQIARALDRVVDRLGGADPGQRGLSDQLGEMRAVRERLDTLERQIRSAEAQPQGKAQGELQRLRNEYAKELQRAREMLGRLERSAPQAGQGGATPEQEERSVADPGTEAFKQDFSGWASLRKDVNTALERRESALSASIAQKEKKNQTDRLSAGGSDRVPDSYRALVARYFESLAKKK